MEQKLHHGIFWERLLKLDNGERCPIYFVNLDITRQKRYDLAKFMDYVNDVFDPLTSYFLAQLKTLPVFGVYIVSGSEGRPDLVSWAIYKDTQFWWPIMFYNDLLSVDDIVQGMSINYFNVSDLESLYFTLNSRAHTQ